MFKPLFRSLVWLMLLAGPLLFFENAHARTYEIVDTGQARTFDDSGVIGFPSPGQALFGQDGQYQGNQPAYRDNQDGTVSDLVTGLMWQKGYGGKLGWEEARAGAASCRSGGYDDWRLPTIKELYSLIDFRGNTGTPPRPRGRADRLSAWDSGSSNRLIPYINTDYFEFAYGDTNKGERYIDAQYWSSTKYVSLTMGGNPTAFGVNFADGRIKGYPISMGRQGARRWLPGRFVKYVRGNPDYGRNRFADNGDGTISDRATGLIWMKSDSGRAMTWQEALSYAENLDYAGKSDWRLPNAKELQSLVDYTRSPDTSGGAAIDPLFQATAIENEGGQKDYAFYWTSTTHHDGPNPYRDAVYIAFGRAMGMMWGSVMDVHGAGAQRSDPKSGGATIGQGPQGDARRGSNFVRCVRGGRAQLLSTAAAQDHARYPFNVDYESIRNRGIQMNHGGGQQPASGGGMAGPGPGAFGASSRHQTGLGGPSMQRERQGGQAMGQGPMGGLGGQGFVGRLDRDGDGKVSRSEFDGPPQHFDILDRNHDGYLEQSEAPPPPSGMMGQPR